MPSDQADVIAFLSRPEAYGLNGGTVERLETHGSIVFLAGARAYKLKRAVQYDYMDYSTTAKRERMCKAELDVNRRMAPEIYLGVEVVTRDSQGHLHLTREPATGEIVDWVVVMRRFEQSHLLDEMRRDGLLTPALMRATAARLAAFHNAAEVIRERAGAAAILAVIDESTELLVQSKDNPFAAEAVDRFDTLARARLSQVREALDKRRADGHVRRVHGDLHLNNICLIEGAPVPFDAIEFNEAFSCIDTLYDLAFLLMDLDRHGLCICANALLNRYLELTRDYDHFELLPLFLACRAAIRAHVTVTTATVRGAGNAKAWRREATGLLDRACTYLAPRKPGLIVIGGLSGTGKSTLAYGLAPLFGSTPGAVVLRSDVIRKELWGIDETKPLPESAYSPDFAEKVFNALGARAEKLLNAGCSVIADAVFGQEAQRVEIAAIARRAGAALHPLWLEAPQALLEARVAARRGDASDATASVVRTQRASVDPPRDWTRLSAACAAPELLAQSIRSIGLAV